MMSYCVDDRDRHSDVDTYCTPLSGGRRAAPSDVERRFGGRHEEQAAPAAALREQRPRHG